MKFITLISKSLVFLAQASTALYVTYVFDSYYKNKNIIIDKNNNSNSYVIEPINYGYYITPNYWVSDIAGLAIEYNKNKK